MSQEVHDQLVELVAKSQKSLGDIVRENLKVQARFTKTAYETGYKKGFQAARSYYQVTYRCNVCGQEVVISSEAAKEAAARFMNEAGWGHAACHTKG